MKLKISESRPAAMTFKDETKRYFERLKGMTGRDIELSDLVSYDSRISFVNALPGMGKTVLTKQLAFLWASDELYSQFTLCIVMEGREINNFARKEGAALKKHELLSEFMKKKFKFELKGGIDTLFIFDGVDELFDISYNDSVLWQLLDIENSKYPLAKIILTGRPHIEGKLERQDKEVGGVQKYEIQGLDDEQIKDYVTKFTSCEEEVVDINKAIDSSKGHVNIIYIPEFLNSFCCVILLSDKITLKNTTELYVWVLYLLLKEHYVKEGPSKQLCSKIFSEYSNELWKLCELCNELLNKNRIVFEGSVRSRLFGTRQGTEFLESLFVDLSDNRTEKYQFKHLTLMEFLSAVHICRMKKRIEIIGDNLRNEFYQLVIFTCQLIGGCKYDGIIQDMFGNDVEVKAISVQTFLPSVLELLGQQQQQGEQLFQLSIDIIMCFINRDVTVKEFIISTVKTLRCKMNGLYSESMKKVSEISDHLLDEFKCNEKDLKETFENVLVEVVWIDDVKPLTCVKYLPNVQGIVLNGMKTNILCIRDEVNAAAKWKEVRIVKCELTDDKIGNVEIAHHELEELEIIGCKLDKTSFIHLCNWSLASRAKVFKLLYMENIELSWWKYLVGAISNAYEESNESFALQKLDIRRCTQKMSKEMQMKVRRFTN